MLKVFPGEIIGPIKKVNGVGQTSFPDVFLAGDFLLGPKTVVQAVQSAKTAVQGITEFLK